MNGMKLGFSKAGRFPPPWLLSTFDRNKPHKGYWEGSTNEYVTSKTVGDDCLVHHQTTAVA
jgi:hypothetical protein